MLLSLLGITIQTNAYAKTQVALETSLGEIIIELNEEKAPITTENFLKYVNDGFYSNTIFHRVIPGFMIQGGGFTADMQYKTPTYPAIKNEADNDLKNARGSIAMARTNDINSATSQFFINVVDNKFLDYTSPSNYGYAVFGNVVKGMEVADKIVARPTKIAGPHRDVPQQTITILSAKVLSAEAKLK